jgi:putative tryptophan/tyrosine transport system substrate-binding protein
MIRLRTRFLIGAVAAATISGGGVSMAVAQDAEQLPADERTRIDMAIIVNNLPVDQNVEGFKVTMAENGYVEGQNIEYTERNAFGRTADSDLIAKQTVDEQPDLIYVVGTPIVIALHNRTEDIPVVFSLMTDPVGGGVVDSFEEPGGNFTGTSDAVSPPIYFDMIEQVLPDCQTVGIMGNTGEQNSASQIAQFEAEAAARGLTTAVAPVATTNDVLSAVSSLEGRADCLLVGADGTVLAAVDALLLAASDAGLPLVTAGAEYADQGALIGIGPDFYDLGVASADIVIQILEGANPADIPVVDAVTGGGLFVAINKDVADALGVTIPDGIDAEIVGGDAE